MTELFNNAAVPAAVPVPAPAAAKKHGWLPLLTVLFCISYGLMTMLIVEQGRTIESQRALIRELFRDSSELSANKMKAQQDRMAAGAQRAQSNSLNAQASAPQNPSSQKQSAQAPSTQAPSTQAQQQAPSSQAVPRHPRSQTEKEKQKFQTPSRPATDQADDARALITI